MLMPTEQEWPHASLQGFQFVHICSCSFPGSLLGNVDVFSDKLNNRHQKTI